MTKLPLSAFAELALNEIQHIADVMRDADRAENEDLEGAKTIKRKPPKKKVLEEVIYENNLDTNNNDTLKRNEITDRSPSSNGIPSVPRVHMGAGFMKIFNQCPLKIHGSYCWVNSETRGENLFSEGIGSSSGLSENQCSTF